VLGMGSRQSGKAIVVSTCLAICLYRNATASTAPADETAPLSVNHCAVSAEEFKWFMQQERAGVFQELRTRCKFDYGKGFWDRNCAGTTAKKLIEKRTINRIVRDTVQQLLFKDLGLIEDARYSVFLENLENLNANRERAAQQGRVIYGPVRYGVLQYYGHWMATLQIRAKEKLSRGEFRVTDEKLRVFAGKTWPKRPFEQTKELARATYIDQAYQHLVDARIANAMVKTNAEAVRAILTSELPSTNEER